ncbi:MAG: class I SAM-dependent methyltransferase [Geobacteraceae bacterium]|nr:class I SAM-dependent methyltransferase [Geobacteraceae bacterium]
MSHPEQMFFFENVRAFMPDFFQNAKVLEIGSLDVNGTVRVFFDSCDYTGLDIGPGPQVDIVCSGEDFGAKATQYDVVVSTEVFEHTANWDLIVLNMIRVMKRTGIMIFSCASSGSGQHGTSLFIPDAAPHVSVADDYYRNLLEDDFKAAFRFDYWFADYYFMYDQNGLFFVGLGRDAIGGKQNLASLKAAYAEYLYKKNILGLPHNYILNSLVTGGKV